MYNPDHKLVEYLKSKKIVPEAYSPLGSVGSPLLDDEVVVEIASKHNLKSAGVLLAWLRMSHVHFALTQEQDVRGSWTGLLFFWSLADKKGCVVVPKSVTPSRIDANLTGFIDALGKLDESDVEKLDGVAASGKQKRFIMPPWGQSPSLLSSACLSQYIY